jgi:hypothetical protein
VGAEHLCLTEDRDQTTHQRRAAESGAN